MRPIIGILPFVDEEKSSRVLNNYVSAVERSGGMGILLPYTTNAEIVDRFISVCDGFLFTGGVDIDPARYGEEMSERCGKICHDRDEAEFFAFKRILDSKEEKPILGICRGSQLINTALGGTLYQDIPSEIETTLIHRQGEPHSAPSHEVNITEGTPLASLFGEKRAPVNSLHHQSTKKLGEGLCIMARADDGVIEAAYMPSRKFLWAIQWHPERSFDTDERSRKIFGSFVDACINYRAEADK